MTDKNGYIDRSETSDEFLASDRLMEETEKLALKRIIADQLTAAMIEGHVTKTAMAKKMGTSRMQLDRLLDPAYPSVTLSTLRRAATAVGRTLRVELV